jgi:septal ring factor EnvC (AmiA/AmiB activator)
MTICCAVGFKASAQPSVSIPEQLEDKSWLIQIGGQRLKCIDAETVRRLQQTKLDLEECQRRLALTEQQVQKLLTASQQWRQAHDNLAQQLAIVKGERDEWAKQAEMLAELVPSRPNGKVASLMAQPVAQLGFALLPVLVRAIWK